VLDNLVPRVLSFPSPGARERDTLENTGQMSPRIWEMTKHNVEGGAGKSGVTVRICSPSIYVEQRNNKLSPHTTVGQGIKPEPYWWKASAVTNAPTLLTSLIT